MAGKRASIHKRSESSMHSIDSFTMDEKEAWRQLRKELEKSGISAAVLKEHRQFIVTWFQRAVEAGALVEESDAKEKRDAEENSDTAQEGTKEPLVPTTLERDDVTIPLTLDRALEREHADLNKHTRTNFI